MTIFGEILAKKRNAQIIYENELVLAFLDAYPSTEGHTLIIPKVEVDYYRDVDDTHYLEVFKTAKFLTPAIEKAAACDRLYLFVKGYTVPHFHLHMIPASRKNRNPQEGKVRASDEELEKVQARILANLGR